MPNGDDHRELTLGEMAVAAEDRIDRLEKANLSLRDQLRAAEGQVRSLLEAIDLVKKSDAKHLETTREEDKK